MDPLAQLNLVCPLCTSVPGRAIVRLDSVTYLCECGHTWTLEQGCGASLRGIDDWR
jgi:hypothetical protein